MGRNNFRKTAYFSAIFFLTLAVLATITHSGAFAAAKEKKSAGNLIILFTHDMHSTLEEYTMPAGNAVIVTGGYERLGSAIKKERSGRERNTLLLDAGDFSMGTFFHVIRSAVSAELRVMGLIGYDATTFGNHDFDYGPDQLAQALLAAKKYNKKELPAIVASNTIIDPQIKALDNFRKACAEYPVVPYEVIERAGLRIGIFGLMGKDAATYVPEAKPVEFSDPIDAAHIVVDILRNKEKVDMVICLSHCGTWWDKNISEDEILAKKVPGIDVIISGHTHTVLDPYIYIGNTCIVSAGAYGRYLGRLELTESGVSKFKVIGYRLIPITSEFPKDQKISRLIDSFKKEINAKYLKAFHYRYGQPLAYLPYSLTDFNWGAGSREKLITSGLGDLVTDAFRYAVKKAEGRNYKDISLVFEGFGQIRVPLAKGVITVNDAFRLMALGFGPDGMAGSPLVTFWLTGKEIKNFLELETTLAPTREDMHLQISGMRFSYDPRAPEFKRIKKVEVETADGGLEPLENGRLYRVCTNWKTILMAESVKNLYKEKIEFTPKDVSGNPIIDIRATIVYTDKRESVEMKEWLAVALYLQSFPVGSSGLPEVPAEYRTPKAMVTVVE